MQEQRYFPLSPYHHTGKFFSLYAKAKGKRVCELLEEIADDIVKKDVLAQQIHAINSQNLN